MKTIDRYIATDLLKTTSVALVVLLVIFTFPTMIDQLEDTGRGNYHIPEAIQYVLLTMPRITYELVPIAAIMGSITTLGLMSNSNELVVIRTSGVSLYRLCYSMFKGGLAIVLFALLLGEFVAPYSEEKAQHLRSVAISEQISLKTGRGFWTRDGRSFINIRTLLPGDKLEDIYIYEFDNDDLLRTATHAENATYRDGQWLLEDIEQSIIDDRQIVRNEVGLALWDSLLNPDVLNLVTVKPQYLTIRGLVEYINYLKQNDQNSEQYEQALWGKVINPFTITAMILLAVPLVKTYSRSVSVSQRIFIGCFIGIAFHIINQVAGKMGVVYSINPFLSTALPTVAIAVLTVYLVRRSA